MNYLFINKCIDKALKNLNYKKPKNYIVEPTRDILFGDFATNIAMILAKTLKKNPIDIANDITKIINKNNKQFFSKIEVVKPGFINFFVNPICYNKVLSQFVKTSKYKPTLLPKSKRKYINCEFVSANPTGALHLGHVRNAYISEVLYNVLKSLGHRVVSDYWLNDMGAQIDLFEVSCLCRYLELFGKKPKFPENGYKGEDPFVIGKKMKEKFGNKFLNTKFNDLKIEDTKARTTIWKFAIGCMVEQIKDHLKMINVLDIKLWTSETWVYKSGILEKLLNTCLKKYTYTKDGAVWLKTTIAGQDDKDRVLIKNDGTRTYMLTDIGYQYYKNMRKFDLFLQIWGSDHEGHLRRMKSIMPMLGIKPEKLCVVMMQMVKIVNNGQEIKLSKRLGNAITIPDMLKIMSVDTSRWYILAQSPSTSIIIDLAKVSKMDNTNPVFYVQYAHARISQLLKKVKLKDKKLPTSYKKLTSNNERHLINMLMSLEPVLHSVSATYEPNRLVTYVHELAKTFHAWYNEFKLKDLKDDELKKQRYYLAKSVGNAIKFVLTLLGINAPNKMDHLNSKNF
ncbi:arginine--tRNA ligase [Mycoplasmoides pirum]|uniref:arginine--tRNA ligase n=1 Tax=Mycoplasmoides pirum TaxID=2122 RepID=UPI00048658A3|nr:arginine--tRNA ligase [Mycoplasmoides pirum]